MQIFFIILLIFSAPCLAADFSLMTGWEKLAEENACPSIDTEGTIMGVNVVTGAYHDSALDYLSNGIDPLRITRSYYRESCRSEIYNDLDMPNLFGWYVNYEDVFYTDHLESNDALNVLWSHPSGCLLHFEKDHKKGVLAFKKFKGFMNDSSSLLSGQTHPKNAFIKYPSRKQYDLHLPDGAIIYFKTPKGCIPPIKTLFQMKRNATGSTVTQERGKLVTKGADGTVLNWLKLVKEGCSARIETSDAKTFLMSAISTQCWEGHVIHLLTQFVCPDGFWTKYQYVAERRCEFISGKYMPEGRYIKISYRDYDGKVDATFGPGGPKGEQIPLFRFNYSPYHEKWTEVFDAKGNKTRFEYDKENRITSVAKYQGTALARVEKNVWDACGCLLGKTLYTPEGKPVFSRTFEYDDKGNVLCEKMHGTLTGKSHSDLMIDAKGLPVVGTAECHVKRYTYSQDTFNLLTSETDGISTTLYTYVPNTNLLAAKFVFDEGKNLRLRQFRSYDGMGALAEVIEDDGNTVERESLSGCTLRKMRRLTNKKTFPGAGQPESIEEFYIDFKDFGEKLLRRTVYHYDEHNKPVQEDVYGADGNFAYTVKREYDLVGRCIYEKDPLGYEIIRTFDVNGNLVFEKGPNEGLETTHGYDLMNRKIWTLQKDLEGHEKRFSFSYDLAGNLVSKVDDKGNATTYSYDGLNQQIGETLPPTACIDGTLKKGEKRTKYDVAGRIQETTDEEGTRTEYVYNVRGQPIKMATVYPSGKREVETYTYDTRGNCVAKVDACGTKTSLSYDFLDRILSVEVFDKAGKSVSISKAVYNAFSPIQTTDAEGVVTTLEYDGAGRERKITKGAACIEKSYDGLGRLSEEKEWYSQTAFLIKRYKYDACNQMIEEACGEDGRLYLLKRYGYDACKNKVKTVTYSTPNSPEETLVFYDAFNREIKKIDAMGNVWTTEYGTKQVGNSEQKKEFKITRSPDRSQEICIYDARGRLEKQIRRDCLGKVEEEREFRYDGISNLISLREGTSVTRFFYEGTRQIRVCEEAQLDNPRQTFFEYDSVGRLVRKETCGSVHEFSYDALGRVTYHKAVDSHGGALDISYGYDHNGKPIKIVQNGRETLRQYDENGHLLFEKQESGLFVSYTYDGLGRRTSMQLPDHSSIEYAYKGPGLDVVSRFDSSHKLRYKHTYLKRDLAGRACAMRLADPLKKTVYEYDRCGRMVSVSSIGFGQRVTYDGCGNISESTIHDCIGMTPEHFAYSSLQQLVIENGLKYAYDALGNRLDGEIGRYNQLTEAIGTAFSYNAEGYLTKAAGAFNFTCSYDPLGRMVKYQDTQYTYDGLSRRISKDDSVFLYDGMHEIGRCSPSGEFIEFRLLGEGKGAELGSTLAVELDGTIYSVAHDVRGNIAYLSDSSNTKWECIRYTAFGETTSITSPNGSTLNPWRFCGKREDTESGLVFFGRRYYMAKIGRWLTPDPAGLADGINLYAFVHNNPLTHYDLYGFVDEMEPRWSPCHYIERGFFYAGKTIEWIGKNLIPIPGVRDIVEDIGRALAGGNLLDPCEYHENKTHIYEIEGKKKDGETFINVNGIANSLEDAKKVSRVISFFLGGLQVFGIYNASNGLSVDIMESIILKIGFMTGPEKKILEIVRSIRLDSPNELIHIFAHSQGGLHLYHAGKQLERDEKQNIDVHTFGSAQIITPNIFPKALNHISKGDGVSLLDLFNYTSARINGSPHVNFVEPQTRSPFEEHYMMGKTYQGVLSNLCNNFIEK